MVIITKVFIINENVYHSLILRVWGYLLIYNMQELSHYKKMVSMSHFLWDCPSVVASYSLNVSSAAVSGLNYRSIVWRYSGSYGISPKYRLIDRYTIYRSIAIPSSIDIERSQVSRYFDISSIEPALAATAKKASISNFFSHALAVPRHYPLNKRARNAILRIICHV